MATATEYNFTQQVDYPSVLIGSIQSSTISTVLINVETSGTGPTMLVSIWFKDVLSSADQTTLNSVMSTYVNSPPAPTIPTSVPSVIQILGADSVSICPFGTMFTATANQTTTYDLKISSSVYLKGGIMYTAPGTVGDTLTVQVIDKDNITGLGANTVLATYINNWYVIPEDMNAVEDVSLSQPMVAGLYIRFIYNNSNPTTNSQVIVNLLAYQGNAQ